jgi:BarA-like signal transduction histidine kinase
VWQVIYIAPNMQAAERLRDLLTREGILVSLRPTGMTSANGAAHVELLVPQGEAREAHQMVNEALGRARFEK